MSTMITIHLGVKNDIFLDFRRQVPFACCTTESVAVCGSSADGIVDTVVVTPKVWRVPHNSRFSFTRAAHWVGTLPLPPFLTVQASDA